MPQGSRSSEIPAFLRELYEELSQDLQNTYLKWKMYRQVFGPESNAIDFLDGHAPSFFLAVRDSFSADLVISVTRFTDSARGTLTLSSVVKHLEKSSHSDLVATLKSLQAEIVILSKPIKKWRDNLVAHRNLKSAGASPQEPLPNVSWDQIDAVLGKLADALNAIQVYFTNADTGYSDIITHGDGDEVLRLMRLGAEAEAAQIEADLADEQ